jgi:hypothetical protein
MEVSVMGNASLDPWLRLEDELEQFVQFMHAARLVPRRTTASGDVEFVDVGESAVARMRASAAKRWRFSAWRRWQMEGAIRMTIYTLYRKMADGAFYSSEGTPEHEEMMRRIGSMEGKLKELSE